MTPLEKLLLLAAKHNEEEDCYAHLMGTCPWFNAVSSGRDAVDHSMCKPAPKRKDVKAVVKLAGHPQTLEEANYRETDSLIRNCASCEYSKNWKMGTGLCTMFDKLIKRGHVCDEWEQRKVKLTPHTAEASTVPKPTVPPGGPGLFHIKGRELPPYVQHLWHHLAPKYGKEKAYGMAVGIVKKWASGVNPGGKHPTKTHADVRAAASKNVAQWERDKADAHAQSKERHRG